jgi:hypothetical protein
MTMAAYWGIRALGAHGLKGHHYRAACWLTYIPRLRIGGWRIRRPSLLLTRHDHSRRRTGAMPSTFRPDASQQREEHEPTIENGTPSTRKEEHPSRQQANRKRIPGASQPPAASKQCSAQHPSPEPQVVPRETPAPVPTRQPTHPPAACPSLPSRHRAGPEQHPTNS